ncbi:phage tail-like protein [Bradyrhizobium sp. AZCC 1588]|uniref:phage tail protein n=1 Tax=unclassified Bradyrhizobium TaxID=2631580 RepID=UPI002FF406E2
MNGEHLKVYRFATSAQWQAGLLDRLSLSDDGLSALARLRQSSDDEYAGAVDAVAVSRSGELFWIGGGRLHTRPPPQDESCTPDPGCDVNAAGAIAQAARLVAWRKWLWAFDRQRATITRYYADSLQQAESVSLTQIAGAPIAPGCEDCDIAPDGDDGLWLLVGRQHRAYRLRAHATRTQSIAVPAGVTCLTTIGGRERILVLLDPAAGKLHFVPVAAPQQVVTLALDAVAPTVVSLALGSNGTDRVLLAGDATRLPDDTSTLSPAHRLVLVLDASGGLVDYLDRGPPPSSAGDLTGLGDTLWVADAQGLHRFTPDAASGHRLADGWFVTPLLISPQGRDSGWLRAELVAELPPGAMMRVRYASTDSISKKDQVVAISEDKSLPQGMRRRRVAAALQGLWSEPLEFVGEQEEPRGCGEEKPPQPVRIAPLHAAPDPWLWLEVELRAPAPDRAPCLRELRVRYPELSLIRHLPAIYRSEESRNTFLRRIVAVLEATTQDLDERIERLGTLVDPNTAPALWLDFLATWLGLPWHDDLPERAKRALITTAGILLKTRGTRAGVLALLRCLLPGRRVRIVDTAVDLEPIIIGARSGACATSLPAVLLGRPNRARVLGSPHAVLGRMQLPCREDNSCDPLAAMEGKLRIEISASPREQRQFDPILRVLLSDFVPAGIRWTLRWPPAAGAGISLENFVLDGYRLAILDHDAVLGRVTLSRETSGRLRPDGLATGFELQ